MERGDHKTLSYKEYEKLAAVTESPYFNAENIKISTMHGIIGIQTEVSELVLCVRNTLHGYETLDEVNFKEELGDILWYLSAIGRAEGWDSFEYGIQPLVYHNKWEKVLTDLQIVAGNLVDCVKKSLFYGININVLAVRNNSVAIYHYVNNLCSIFDWDIEELMAQNISKLKKRYPEKFTSEHSINRLDKT